MKTQIILGLATILLIGCQAVPKRDFESLTIERTNCKAEEVKVIEVYSVSKPGDSWLAECNGKIYFCFYDPKSCSRRDKDCLEGVDQTALMTEGAFHIEKTYPLLVAYRKRFGRYPRDLDSLTFLDSIDYSYLKTSWNLQYVQKENGQSFELNSKNESKITERFEKIQRTREEVKKRMQGC